MGLRQFAIDAWSWLNFKPVMADTGRPGSRVFDGQGLSFRPIFGGTTVQLWITGSSAPPLPDDTTLADPALRETQLTARLAEGHRYNKATTLVTEADEDPELVILRTLEDDLLPAFDYKPRYVGHQPWIDLFGSALAAVTSENGALAAGEHSQDSLVETELTPQGDSGSEPERDTAGAKDEEPAPLDQGGVSEEALILEPGNGTEVAPQPVHRGECQPVPEPPLARRSRKRNPKHHTSTIIEPS